MNFKSLQSHKTENTIPWHWNSINEASMFLPKVVLNNFTKAMFF